MPEFTEPGYLQLLTAAAGTGLSTSYDLGSVANEFSLLVETTGSPTFSVQFQGSLDGTNWLSIGSAVTAVQAGSATPAAIMARYLRANLTALSGGTLTAGIAYTRT